jgi:hypothetical protein
MEQKGRVKERSQKNRLLAAALSFFILAAAAKASERKKVIDCGVGPAAKAGLAKNNATLAGAGFQIDGFGYKSVEVNFGKLYGAKGVGFLIGIKADLPFNAKDATQVQGQTYEIYSFGRKGFLLSIAGLIGRPGKIFLGVKAGIGFQISQVNEVTVDIGDSTIDAYLAGYTPVPGTNNSTLFLEAGGLFLIPIGKSLYIRFEGGAKGLVHPTEQENTYIPIEYRKRTGLYAGVGLEASF